MSRQRVWDLPTRVFHWLLVVGIIAAVASGKIGGTLIGWHGRVGLFILGLLVFRIVWGFVGSPTARFSHFVRGPSAIRAYLRGEWRGVGHNPLGALAVLALLVLIATQIGTGLFANDDIVFQGPLADLVSKELSDEARAWHSLVFNALLGMVVLHLAAIAFYTRVKRESLLRPMITGWKEAEESTSPDVAAALESHPGKLRHTLAFVAAATIATTTVYAASGGLFSPPPPPPPVNSGGSGW
jgi:cytochrome b